MGLTNFPYGVSSFGSPVLPHKPTRGKVFFVDSAIGSNGNSGLSVNKPLATLAYAISLCTDSQGDVIYLMQHHAETNTAVITINKIGISIIGLGNGTARPTFTVGTNAVDCMSVTAANVTIENIYFAAPAIDAVTADINVAAAGCVIRDCVFIGSTTAKNKVDFITLTATADDCLIERNFMYNKVVEMDGGAISFEGACSRVVIQDNFIMDSIGFALGAIYDGATALQILLRRNILKNAKAATVVLEFGNNTTGICSFNHISGRHTTIASNVAAGTGMDFFENRVTEEAALNGMIMPAADAD